MTSLRQTLCALAFIIPMLRGAAQEVNLLDVTSRVTPALTFTQKYAETLVNDPDLGPTVTPSGSFTLKIVGSLQGVDQTALDGSTAVGFACGTVSDSHALGDDPAWKPGNRTATFVTPGPLSDPDDEDSEPTVAATVTYAWTDTTLTVTCTGRLLDAGLLADPTAYDDGKIADTTTLSVTFGPAGGSHNVRLSGTRTTTHRTVGSGDEAQDFDLVSGTITGAGDYFGPKLALAQIPARTSAGDLPVTITSDAVNVSLSLNGGDFAPLEADPQTGRWQTSLTLQPGANHLEVRADDGGDGLSAAGADVFYTVPTTLTISTSGQGTVTAALRGTTTHPIGEMLTAVATPAAGQIFTGWSGDLVSDSPTLSFAVTEKMSLTASFAPSPYVAVSGSYSATFQGTPAGALRLALTASGAYTGQIQIGGRTYALLGRMLADGTSTAEVKTDAYHQKLTVSLSFADGVLSGTISFAGGSASSFTASALGGKPPASLAGAWTVVLRSTQEDFPSVAGFATMRVSAAGAVVLTGRLSDGLSLQPLSAGGQIGGDSVLHLYSSLYPRSRQRFGALAGDMRFDSRCTGALTIHAEQLKTSRLTGTTSTVVADDPLQLSGSHYVPVAPGAAALTIASDLSDFTLQKTVQIRADGSAVVKNPARDAASLRVALRTGFFTGGFVQTALGYRIGYAGVLESGSTEAGGVYLRLRYLPAQKTYTGDFGHVTLAPVR